MCGPFRRSRGRGAQHPATASPIVYTREGPMRRPNAETIWEGLLILLTWAALAGACWFIVWIMGSTLWSALVTN